MACTYQINVGDKERSLFHHGLIKILVSYWLGELGDSWESFLTRNGFGENEEWPLRRPKTRWRHIKTEESRPELEECGSQYNLDNEVSKSGRTLSRSDFKVNSEVNPETPVDDSRPRTRKSVITTPCPNDGLPHSQTNISKKPTEDQVSRVLSNQVIRRTTHSMTVAFFARRYLSVGDAPAIDLSDYSKHCPNQAPIGPTILELKYVYVSETNVVHF